MPEETSGRSSASIAIFLEGIDFPASKDDLVDHAEDENAPQEIIDVLEQVPDREYRSLADVMLGVAQVE